jgi:YD repeat-containing protein
LGPSAVYGEDVRLGHDINAGTGNLFLAQPDIEVFPGDGPKLVFVRYYNSQARGLDLGIGANWSHTYAWRLAVIGTEASLHEDTGRNVTFTLRGNAFVPMAGEYGSLVGAPGGTWTYTNKFGVAYQFDAAGRLTSIAPADDAPILVSYASATGNEIAQVSSGSMTLVFSYTNGHLSTITDPTGAAWRYLYGGLPSWGAHSPAVEEFFQNQVSAPAGAQLLSDVRAPIASGSCPGRLRLMTFQSFGDSLYSYSDNQWFKEETVPRYFIGAPGEAELTAYAKTVSGPALCFHGTGSVAPYTIALLGLYSFADMNPTQSSLLFEPGTSVPPQSLSEVASGIADGQLLGDIQMQFVAGSPTPQFLGSAYIEADFAIGGRPASDPQTTPFLDITNRKAISRLPIARNPRKTSLASSSGIGIAGEKLSESWTWNNDLTLASYTDGVGTTTSISSYDALGNPTQILEGSNLSSPRLTTICYHPVLSRPLVLSRPSNSPGHFHTIAWDYTYNFGPPSSITCNQTPLTNVVSQIVESGYTDKALSGQLSDADAHVVQMGYQQLDGSLYGPFPPNQHLMLSTVLGPLAGAQTTFFHDPRGNVSVSWRLISNESTPLTFGFTAYDSAGRVTQMIDPTGVTHGIGYDQQGRIVQRQITGTAPANGSAPSTTELIVYDLAGNPTAHQTVGGSVLSINYDSGERPTWVRAQSSQGNVSWSRSLSFDAWGKPATRRLFSGSGKSESGACASSGLELLCTGYSYDAFERLTQEVHLRPDDSSCGQGCGATFLYDDNGEISSHSVFEDNTETLDFRRDGLHRITQIFGAGRGGGVRTLSYDVNDRLTGRFDARGIPTTFVYDDFGNLIQTSSSDEGTWISNYDAAGNLTNTLDPLGQSGTNVFDELNRRTSFQGLATPSRDDVVYVYDETGPIPGSAGLKYANTKGRLTSVLGVAQAASKVRCSALGSCAPYVPPGGNALHTHFNYDYRGWITQEVDEFGGDLFLPGAPQSSTTTYVWGPNHELSTLTYPDGQTAQFGYSGGYLDPGATPLATSVSINFGGKSINLFGSAAYFADGGLSSIQYGSGSTLTVSRNKRGEVNNVNVVNSGTTLFAETYSYGTNKIGLVTGISAASNVDSSVRQIGYNPYGAITSYVRNPNDGGPTQSFQWCYDPNGNPAVQALNNSTPCQFDSSGNAIVPTSIDNNAPIVGDVYFNLSPQQSNLLAGFQGISVNGPNAGQTPMIVPLTYDQAGDLACNTANPTGLAYSYNSRHVLSEVDFEDFAFLPNQNCYTQTDFWYASSLYNYDGLNRLWQRLDGASYLYSASGSEPMGSGSHQYFYDPDGRLIQEMESLGQLGSPNYLITEHVYLGNTSKEVARVVRQWQSKTNLWTDLAIQYIYQDGRGAIGLIEVQDTSGHITASRVSPYLQLQSFGPQGPGVVGATAERFAAGGLPATLQVGVSGASGAPYLDNALASATTCGGSSQCAIVGFLDPMFGRLRSPGTNFQNPYGWSPVTGSSVTDFGGAGAGGGGSGLGGAARSLLLLALGATPKSATIASTALKTGMSKNLYIQPDLLPYVTALAATDPDFAKALKPYLQDNDTHFLQIVDGDISFGGALADTRTETGNCDLSSCMYVTMIVDRQAIAQENATRPGTVSIMSILAHEGGHLDDAEMRRQHPHLRGPTPNDERPDCSGTVVPACFIRSQNLAEDRYYSNPIPQGNVSPGALPGPADIFPPGALTPDAGGWGDLGTDTAITVPASNQVPDGSLSQ